MFPKLLRTLSMFIVKKIFCIRKSYISSFFVFCMLYRILNCYNFSSIAYMFCVFHYPISVITYQYFFIIITFFFRGPVAFVHFAHQIFTSLDSHLESIVNPKIRISNYIYLFLTHGI